MLTPLPLLERMKRIKRAGKRLLENLRQYALLAAETMTGRAAYYTSSVAAWSSSNGGCERCARRFCSLRCSSCILSFGVGKSSGMVPHQALRRYDPAHARHPTIGADWLFQVGLHDSNWIIERHIVREYGVVVWGPGPQTMLDPVSPQELRAAVCEQLENVWQSRLDDPEWLRPRDHQTFAVLTLCRALYTLQQGMVGSKPQAAAWAQEMYPGWKPVIERALTWRSQPDKDDLTATIAFLRDALIQAQKICEQA